MTLLKRLLTAMVLFIPLFIFFYFVICAVGGGIAGGRVAAENPNASDLSSRSRQAGADFVRNNLPMIAISALGLSLAGSAAISFTGLLPWCRKPNPPPIPAARL
jgi:hypothetical protein